MDHFVVGLSYHHYLSSYYLNIYPLLSPLFNFFLFYVSRPSDLIIIKKLFWLTPLAYSVYFPPALGLFGLLIGVFLMGPFLCLLCHLLAQWPFTNLKFCVLPLYFLPFYVSFFFPCAIFFFKLIFFFFKKFFLKKPLFPNSFHPDLPLFFFPSISLNFLFWSFGSFLGLSFSSKPLPSISHRSMQSSVLENPKLLCTLERPQIGWWLLESLSSLWVGELRRSCCSWVSVLG